MSEMSALSTPSAIGRPMTRSSGSGWARRLVTSRSGAVAIALVMIGTSLAGGWIVGVPGFATHAPGPAAQTGPVASASASLPAGSSLAAPSVNPVPANPLPLMPPSSGRGTFFTNVPIPNPPAGSNLCPVAWFCWNITNNPSANLSSTGYTGLAYTAYTNDSPCVAMQGNASVPDATTEVGFVVSRNFGDSWSSPVYLGNPSCTGADANYSSAMDPSLTSLGNGTFALAYVEYNYTTQSTYSGTAPPFGLDCSSYGGLLYSRLVVTFSYDGGATWTTPSAVNTSANTGCPSPGFPILRPSITATGQTIYLAWENLTSPLDFCCLGNEYGSVNVVASTNGGSSWSTPVSMVQLVGDYYGTPTSFAMNPAVMVGPSGKLFVAYATNLSVNNICNPICTFGASASIYVATSTNNASSFTFKDVSDGLYLNEVTYYPGVYLDPAPVLAYSPKISQVVVAWAGDIHGNFCYNEGIYGSFCDPYNVPETIWMANSSNGGVNWSTARDVVPTNLINPNGGFLSSAYNPSMAVDTSGRIHLQYSFIDDSACSTVSYFWGNYSVCGPYEQLYQNSTDVGFNWTDPAIVYPNATDFNCPYHQFYCGTWPGTVSTVLTNGSQVLLAWTTQQCPGWASGTYCNPSYPPGFAQVITSRLFEGTGVTVMFSETGGPTGQNWNVNVLGNLREGATGTNLSISGVPTGTSIPFFVPWINVSYGVAYNDSVGLVSPAVFTKNTTIPVKFSEIVLLNVQMSPYVQQYYLQYGYANYNMNPYPESVWLSVNTSVTLTVTSQAFTLPCYDCLNLSFVSWTGSGSGSVNSKSTSVTVTPAAQVNETANFQLNGICNIGVFWGNGCLNFTYAVSFTENGLPSGTAWGVTLVNSSGGASQIYETSAANMTVGVGNQAVYYYLWTVPSSTSGKEWIPSTTATDPILVPQTTAVAVHYTLASPAAASFTTRVVETGLPNGTAWSLLLGNTSYGESANSTTLSLQGDTAISVNGSFVYLPGGTGYYAASVSVDPYEMNATNSTYSVPATVTLNGSGLIEIDYEPMYYVTITGSSGGSVGPASEWVVGGRSINLSESPAAGYHFVGWTGSGSGAVTSTTETSPTVRPSGPVSEFGTFQPNPLPTWELTLAASGLPLGTAFTVTVGTSTYTGAGTMVIPGLPNGTAPVSASLVYLNASDTTRFVPTGMASTLNLSNGVLDLIANGTLTVNYQTQFAVSVQATTGGTTSPAPGVYWLNASAPLALTATPAPGYYFGGWNGTGNGSLSSYGAEGSATANSPLTETALFVLRPPAPPATFWLEISENGLPAGLQWNVSAGSLGSSGPEPTLTIDGLNGTYSLVVPTVYAAPGVRWVANVTSLTLTVAANSTLSLSFSEEFLVTVVPGAGGTVTPLSSWAAAGSQLTLRATANSSSRFVGWNGTGTGSYTGPLNFTALTVSGPITEVANFAPVSTGGAGTASSGGSPVVPVALLVLLLVVGLVVGLLLGRRRTSAPPPEEPIPAEEEPYVPEESQGAEDEPPAPSPSEEYPEGPA